MNEYLVENHEPSILPDGDFQLCWSDEFDGNELDKSKWEFRLNMMGKRWPSWTDSEKALRLDGKSNAVFTLVEEDGRLCCAQLQTGNNYMDEPVGENKSFDQGDNVVATKDRLEWPIGKLHAQKHLFKYGYYECRCRLQQKNGWWSAFWMQSPVIGSTLDAETSGSEVDIMESFRPGKIQWHNVFCAGYGPDSRRTKVGGVEGLDTSVFHRFGLLWDETGYTFYIDGVEDGHVDADVSQIPEFLLISTEVYGYRKPGHAPIPEAYDAVGDTFVVDYVRVFQRK